MHTRLIVAATAWIAFVACATADARKPAAPEHSALPISGFYLPQPLPLQDFALVDQHGQAFTRQHLLGRWTLLMFGYTHCPNVCPTALMELHAASRMLASSAPDLKLAVVFVSVDPQRDRAAQLDQYLEKFGASFVGVAGTPQAIEDFARQFRVQYAVTGRTEATYFLDHTSSVALLTPQAQLRALFNTPLRAATVANDVERIRTADAARDHQAAAVSSERRPKPE